MFWRGKKLNERMGTRGPSTAAVLLLLCYYTAVCFGQQRNLCLSRCVRISPASLCGSEWYVLGCVSLSRFVALNFHCNTKCNQEHGADITHPFVTCLSAEGSCSSD